MNEAFLEDCGAKFERLLPNLNTIEFVVFEPLPSTVTIAHIKAAFHRRVSTHTRVDVKVNPQNFADTWLP